MFLLHKHRRHLYVAYCSTHRYLWGSWGCAYQSSKSSVNKIGNSEDSSASPESMSINSISMCSYEWGIVSPQFASFIPHELQVIIVRGACFHEYWKKKHPHMPPENSSLKDYRLPNMSIHFQDPLLLVSICGSQSPYKEW